MRSVPKMVQRAKREMDIVHIYRGHFVLKCIAENGVTTAEQKSVV